MKRKITFDGETGTKRAGLLYMMVMMGSAQQEGRRSVAEARSESKFYDAMDTIGHLDKEASVGVRADSFKLAKPDASVTIEQAVHEVVKKHIETALGIIAPALLQESVSLYEWFDTAEKLEVY
jgi:hypothetical protein